MSANDNESIATPTTNDEKISDGPSPPKIAKLKSGNYHWIRAYQRVDSFTL